MKVSSVLSSAILALVALAAPSVKPRGDSITDGAQFADLTASIQADVLKSLDEWEARLRKRGESANCTTSNIVFRKEYGALSLSERLSYVNAVKCLQRLPPRTPANVSAGARSRFDDFVVTHIQQTMTIHYTGNFMAWHRWFVYLYEKVLRDECGYTDYQPPPEGIGGSSIQLPAGVGGGFVTTGPFANMTVNLGPVGGLQGTAPGPGGGLGYNPRGLKRDVGPAMNQRYANYTTVLNLLLKPNISEYRLLSEGVPYTP
ncbi:hypothetical protein CSAL01_00697 [Colletotrichum salicis]|uniref:Tyrosinase copper-binding domain-containing protein n=1 Tax=Colletotrichum salicis TaxID=1209931 RepID=A0A135S3L1_9PEZI|nr:hypothetical protein CSAL01_00697 [Colletotrichum salicis]